MSQSIAMLMNHSHKVDVLNTRVVALKVNSSQSPSRGSPLYTFSNFM